MKISTKGEYGIRAMLYIAMHNDQGPVTSKEIATEQAIPEPYLRQILALLSRDRLILSNRGPQGGHVLGRPAERISLRDILLTLEGQMTPIDQILALPCGISIGREYCAIREVFLEVKDAIQRILVRITLADLAARQREVLERKLAIPFDCKVSSPLPILIE